MASFKYPSNAIATIRWPLPPYPFWLPSFIPIYTLRREMCVWTFSRKNGVPLGDCRRLVGVCWHCWVIRMRTVLSIAMREIWWGMGTLVPFMPRLECLRLRMPCIFLGRRGCSEVCFCQSLGCEFAVEKCLGTVRVHVCTIISGPKRSMFCFRWNESTNDEAMNSYKLKVHREASQTIIKFINSNTCTQRCVSSNFNNI